MSAPGAVQTVGPVVYDPQWFTARYPDLARWAGNLCQTYFDLATLYLDNSDGAPTLTQQQVTTLQLCAELGIARPIPITGVTDIPTRQKLLGLLTAHIAQLFAPLNGEPASTLVGRISSATQGSISVSVALPEVAGAEFYAQTQYGLMFWSATARYRRGGLYFPGPGARPGVGYFGRRF